MKKKKVSLEKKLTLNKEAIASLNAAQQDVIAGGNAFYTRQFTCTVTYQETCQTIPPGEMDCVIC
ncbi:MAG: class I lanthipeptide [Chitinophaga sp.]|uniref:class I lanthipeptide n=1 Tax=Chitinophaga sp. TaxID=1869181 RepID=UPI0025C2EF68|nr:class I lanthipeptide [Chitinophaga sp.]MBV8253003.1 class I lanthipeptide [Chitinophaga sp.]